MGATTPDAGSVNNLAGARVACALTHNRELLMKGTAYKERDEVLARLGFYSYGQYLRSELWQSIRSAKLTECPNCELCHRPATCVHHLSYRKECLEGKKPHALVCLCTGCHEHIEFSEEGRKRTMTKGFQILREKLVKAGQWEVHHRQAGIPGGKRPSAAVPDDGEIPY